MNKSENCCVNQQDSTDSNMSYLYIDAQVCYVLMFYSIVKLDP